MAFWYRRRERGVFGVTYPINWKGWLHLFINFALPLGFAGYAMSSGLWDRQPFFVPVIFFVLFLESRQSVGSRLTINVDRAGDRSGHHPHHRSEGTIGLGARALRHLSPHCRAVLRLCDLPCRRKVRSPICGSCLPDAYRRQILRAL
jgi:hypothetical protein